LLKKITQYVINLLARFVFFLNKVLTLILPQSHENFLREKLIEKNDSIFKTIVHRNQKKEIRFNLYTPNFMCSMRANSFSSKEPETLEWIEEFGGSGTFFDIGANIGIYSIYYAKYHKGKVYSFEPSAFNLKQLAKNISINKLEDRIHIIPNPLSNKTSFENFKNLNDTEGGALSAFGVDYGFDGNLIKKEWEYNLLGFSLDYLIDIDVIKDLPSMIKIDVDGIEHLILEGAMKTLKKAECRSVSIEVNYDFIEQYSETKRILENCGFKLSHTKHSDMFEDEGNSSKSYNQLWVKE